MRDNRDVTESMYKLMYEGIMSKVFNSIQTINEVDVENDCLKTNLNIGNLNFESAWEDEIWKSSAMNFRMQKKRFKPANLYNIFG